MNWLVDERKTISQTERVVDRVNVFATLEEAKQETCVRLEKTIDDLKSATRRAENRLRSIPNYGPDDVKSEYECEDESRFNWAFSALKAREPREERLRRFFKTLEEQGFATSQGDLPMNEDNMKAMRHKMDAMEDPQGFCYCVAREGTREDPFYSDVSGHWIEPPLYSLIVSLHFGNPAQDTWSVDEGVDGDEVGERICRILEEMNIPYYWQGSVFFCIHIDLAVNWPDMSDDGEQDSLAVDGE